MRSCYFADVNLRDRVILLIGNYAINNGVDYDTSTSFSEKQLRAITANQVAAYLKLKS